MISESEKGLSDTAQTDDADMPEGLKAMYKKSAESTIATTDVNTWPDLIKKAVETITIDPGWMFVTHFNKRFNRACIRFNKNIDGLINELVRKQLTYHYNEPGKPRALVSAHLMNLMWGGDKEEYPDSTEEERGQRIHTNIGLLCLTVIARERALKRKIR